MNIRMRLYWGVYVRWLTHHDMLDDWMTMVLDETPSDRMLLSSSGLMRERYSVPSHEARGTFTELTEDERLIINFEGLINSQQTRLVIGRRFNPYFVYHLFAREGHVFDGMSWKRINLVFASECINEGKRPQKTRLSTIKRAMTLSGGEL